MQAHAMIFTCHEGLIDDAFTLVRMQQGCGTMMHHAISFY
jgi:ligand-binding sensor protein